ncbi:MAG: oligoendopeptidase F [Thermoanaerobaculaceae bacterium]|nr:oligoendopeptidase F [Thermoanaerobaculaceae bacterium]MDI9621368.1 oligoendopeptidase F [Acidobacteriota bacterium]NLH10355.1 oligoendopeptidase F [Holophagae bacterium]HPW56288.1 oligoendopeptidase F [Thermoanaerobaculaceae bacterium]
MLRNGVLVLVLIAGVVMTSVAGESRVDKNTWQLEDLYPTPEAFVAARADLAKRLSELEKGKGTLGSGPAALLAALEAGTAIRKDLTRLASYASMRADEDTRVPENLVARQEVMQLATEARTKGAWLAPEILALPEGTVMHYLTVEPKLAPYRFFLEDLERQRAHTLSPAEEMLLARTGLVTPTAQTAYGILTDADMPYPTVKLGDGTEVRLDKAAYTRYRAATSREDRIKVFAEFWKTYSEFERTLGVLLDGQVKRDLFNARARKYPSCLTAALDDSNVPESVYHTLLAEANRALPTLHRAFKLRARLLGISDLGYHDIYPPLVPSLEMRFPIDQARALVVEAVAPLGPEYAGVVKKGFESRWMDVYPRPGKRSGAYSNGSTYDVHPYVLMNYNDDYESLSTLAHEWGHAMHSYLANAAQPIQTADYSIFVAEVASTFNEALLLDRMLKQAKTDDERLSLLGSYLEGLRGTFFRQTMFAEFELMIHQAAERGEALSGKKLTEMYGALLRRYHGHDQGVMRIDDAYAVEWAYIPHFYYNFYVYQYATSLAASSLLAKDVLEAKPGARERYLGLLKAGGSKYPYELLKDAGVDLATPAPYKALEARMSWAMDEIEAILARRGK